MMSCEGGSGLQFGFKSQPEDKSARCSMCGTMQLVDEKGIILPHERPDDPEDANVIVKLQRTIDAMQVRLDAHDADIKALKKK